MAEVGRIEEAAAVCRQQRRLLHGEGSATLCLSAWLLLQVLLADERGAVLEGLVTNFAVLAATTGEGEDCSVQGFGMRDSLSALVLQTAAPDEQALCGIGMQAVLAAAGRLGLRVQQCAPCVAERSTWRAAFIVNWYACMSWELLVCLKYFTQPPKLFVLLPCAQHSWRAARVGGELS